MKLSQKRCLLLMLLAGLALGGCSRVGLVYDHLDWLASRNVNGFVELHPDQQRQFDQAFGELWRSHRSTQLPRYAADLRELAAAARQALSTAQLQDFSARAERHGEALAREALPPSARLLATLDDAQVQSMLVEIDRRRAKTQRKRARITDGQWREERYDNALEWLEDWTDDSSPAQQARLRAWSAALSRDLAADETATQARRDGYAQVLQTRRQPGFAQRLEQQLLAPDASDDAADAASSAALASLIQDLSALSTPAQRKFFGARLLSLAAELEVLAAQPPPSG